MGHEEFHHLLVAFLCRVMKRGLFALPSCITLRPPRQEKLGDVTLVVLCSRSESRILEIIQSIGTDHLVQQGLHLIEYAGTHRPPKCVPCRT